MGKSDWIPPTPVGGEILVRSVSAHFDTSMKMAAVQQFMQENDLTFERATELLGFQHGVDFLLVINEEVQW